MTITDGINKTISPTTKPNLHYRIISYYTTGSDAYVSKDRHTTFANLYPAGNQGFNGNVDIGLARKYMKQNTPAGVKSYLTGRDALQEAASGGDNNGPSVLTEALIGGLGAI